MHCLPRRSLAALALCALALPALAQGPITLIVGWPAGGPPTTWRGWRPRA